ncbi:MAG: alpha/beta hydrolase [Clostridia bacterium]|nr:alpha/beta hydrolase [Clostridia bacterium]
MIHQTLTLPTGATLDVYAPLSPLNPPLIHRGILICPGGGYSHLALREAEPIALRFASMGFTAAVVQYHVNSAVFPQALQDAGCAMACMRSHAEEWQLNPDAIAVAGFSAGGHLACSLGVMWQREEIWQPLELTCDQVKPNAMVLCYPVISAGEHAHRGSFECLTGSMDPAVHAAYSLENLVSPLTPPAFLWHTWEDAAVPVENSLLLALALHRHRVQAEVRIYPYGSHGGALADEITASQPDKLIPEAQEWPAQAARFLRSVM